MTVRPRAPVRLGPWRCPTATAATRCGSIGPVPQVPRVVVAAPGSGHGKTTVATGLMAALRARGLEVSGHKIGPDYIDPGYHALATGRPPRNLDPVLQGEHRVAPLFLHGALHPRPADVAVVEGVMGLYDGAIGTGGVRSTAHVARLIDAPVVLVVDVSGASRSVAATVLGFATYDPQVRIAGVVLNRVASQRHEDEIRAALRPTGIPVLGSLGRDDALATPSRHLGLVPAVERADEARAAVAAARRTGRRRASTWTPCCGSPDPPPPLAGRALGPARRGHRATTGPRAGHRHARAAARSASATPRPTSCWPPPAPRSWTSTRCTTSGCPPGHVGALPGRRLPRGLRERAVRERRAARATSPRRIARRPAGGRRVRGTALPVPRARRPADGRRARRHRRHDRPAHPRLPAGHGTAGSPVSAPGEAVSRARVPPHPRAARARLAAAWQFADTGYGGRSEGFAPAGCTRRTCTCTGPATRRPPSGWWPPRRAAPGAGAWLSARPSRT